MRLLLLTWDGAGNQVPMLGMAQALVGRGHEVTVAGYTSQRSRFADFDFRSLPKADAGYPTSPPPEGWLPALAGAVWACEAHLADVPELLNEGSYDHVIADCLMFGALAHLQASATPATVLVHSAPGALAPPGQPLEQMLLPSVNAVREQAEQPPIQRLWDAWTPFPTLCTSIRELDPLAEQVPESFDYIGPLFEQSPSSGWKAPWPDGDPRPLVIGSFSTGVAWDQRSRIQRTLDALDDGHHRVLITTGETSATSQGEAVVLPWLPHAEVLPQASAVVTHAGHGTLAAALAHGVPVVALPNPAADQPALAQRAAELGAGIALDGEDASPADIAAAVRAVIEDPSYRATAARLGDRISAAPGPAQAVAQLERA